MMRLHGVLAGRRLLAATLLLSTLSLGGCGQSGKELAMQQGDEAPALAKQLRERLDNQSDR